MRPVPFRTIVNMRGADFRRWSDASAQRLRTNLASSGRRLIKDENVQTCGEAARRRAGAGARRHSRHALAAEDRDRARSEPVRGRAAPRARTGSLRASPLPGLLSRGHRRLDSGRADSRRRRRGGRSVLGRSVRDAGGSRSGPAACAVSAQFLRHFRPRGSDAPGPPAPGRGRGAAGRSRTAPGRQREIPADSSLQGDCGLRSRCRNEHGEGCGRAAAHVRICAGSGDQPRCGSERCAEGRRPENHRGATTDISPIICAPASRRSSGSAAKRRDSARTARPSRSNWRLSRPSSTPS